MDEKILQFETRRERERRERDEKIVEYYLGNCEYVLAGRITVTRLLEHLARMFSLTLQTVRTIVLQAGVFESAHHPVIYVEKYKDFYVGEYMEQLKVS